MDKEVLVRIIDLAESWAETVRPDSQLAPEVHLKMRAENFDTAYKAIIKIVTETKTE